MTTPPLSRLERVDLRSIWTSEDRHFTPWLAREDNLVLLGDTINLDLELEAEEKSVGPFRADILCKETQSNTWVLVENQLERTDHRHLGQLLTYAAGLEAVTIVWVAAQFQAEHRAAIQWLNRITDERFRFFALEVELWRIGSSPAAPKFNIVAEPNNWSKSVATAARQIDSGGVSELKQQQFEYWQTFAEKLAKRGGFKSESPKPRHWFNVAAGRTHFKFGANVNSRMKTVSMELTVMGDEAKAFYWLLFQAKAAIETEFGEPLSWDPLPNKKWARISLSLADADPTNEQNWPSQHEWLLDKLTQFARTFRTRIRDLNASDWVDDSAEEADETDELA